MTTTRTSAAILAMLISSGCTNLEHNLNDPEVWQRIAEIGQRAEDRRAERTSGNYGGSQQQIDLTGDWQLSGSSAVNRIRHRHDGIQVTPAGGNKSVRYQQIGPNLYVHDGMTYEFSTIHNGVWHSNDDRNLVIRLRRLTFE
ncbi:MAG: hypothetical protein AAGA68_25905 [Pseudomonadota bacterium]